MKHFAALVFLGLLAFVLAACGGDSRPPDSAPAGPADGVAAGSVAPNTFLRFQGKTYRLADIIQAGLVPAADFKAIGTTNDADIDFSGSLEVYSRRGDGAAVFTLSPARGSGEGAVPALWLRWLPDEADGGSLASGADSAKPSQGGSRVQSGGPHPGAEPQEPGPIGQLVEAPIASIEIVSGPDGHYVLKVRARLPDGCTKQATHDVVRQASVDLIRVKVWNARPTDQVACNLVYGEYSLEVDLGAGFQKGTTYRVEVNSLVRDFTP
ncbi:MAG TPA: hypothetical protein VNN10_12625 [Dehalococcoidia bacterium]|nr:hypothetical protein [Dehalococcoidia bacterium]